MTRGLQRSPKPVTLARAMRRAQPSPPSPPARRPAGGDGGRLAAAELHAWRVAWGHYFGGRISELTREWKEGLR